MGGFNYFEFAKNVCDSLYRNLNTLGGENTAENIWTDCTAQLNQVWLTGGSDTTIKDAIAEINTSKDNGNPWGPGNYSVAAFIREFMPSDNYYLYSFSMTNITQLYSALSQYYDSTSGATQLSTIQQYGNLISATQQIETSTGETEQKAQASFMQQTISSGQPISDLGNSVIGLLTTAGSIMMQSFL